MQIGHLDNIVDGEISGWALDTDSPDRPIEVTVYIEARLASKALAVYYRPDVAARHNSSGRHGFYIDLRAELALCEVTLDVRLPNGNSLQRSDPRQRT